MNFEFVRKEAKSLLKLCRARDSSALSRIRANLPRFAGLTNEQAAGEIQLADVQHALARECGLASWSDFQQQASSKARPDFSRPGDDGESLPEGFNPWHSCVSYTARPEIHTPLNVPEYRIFVRVLRKGVTYGELYNRALAIAKGRAASLRSSEGLVLHSRIAAQGWFRYEAIDVPTAYVTLNVTAHRPSDAVPEGLIPPTAEELAKPGGMTPETVPASAVTSKDIDESYTDQLGDDQEILLVSYGEYVSSLEGVDYAPFVERAEKLTKFHSEFLKGRWTIIRREWFCATTPDIVVVHIFLRQQLATAEL